MRVKAATASGARLAPSGILATSPTDCSPAGVDHSDTAVRLVRPRDPMRARTMGASIGTEPTLRMVPEMVIGALGTATSGLTLARVTAAGPVTAGAVTKTSAVERSVTAPVAMAGDQDATVGDTETASRAAQAASRRTSFRLWVIVT